MNNILGKEINASILYMVYDELYSVIYVELNHRTSIGVWMLVLSIAENNVADSGGYGRDAETYIKLDVV